MAVSALAQLLDQQPTAYAEVLAACRAMGWNASPTAQPQDLIDELPSNVLPFIRRMLALLIYGDGSADSPAVVPVTERCYAQMLARQASPNYPAAGFPSDGVRPFLPQVPSDRDFAHLPQALSALADRKISGADVADGMSLVHLLCSTAANDVTEIKDDNVDWACTKGNYVSFLNGLFPNAEEITLRCKDVNAVQTSFTSSAIKKLNIIGAKTIVGALCINLPDGEINAPDLETLTLSGYNNGWVGPIGKVIYMPRVTTINGYNRYFQGNTNMPIERWVLGTLKSLGWTQWGWTGSESAPDLIDFEICADGGKLAMSLNLNFWTATNVLADADKIATFLQNFRSHIAERLTDNGSGLTLTLSQAVYDAIKDETHLFVFDEGTMTIYAYLTNIKHWTVTK